MPKLILLIFINTIFVMSVFGACPRPGRALFSVNGDNGLGDSCEFYHDLTRMKSSLESGGRAYDCKIPLVPPETTEEIRRACGRQVRALSRESEPLDEASFFQGLSKVAQMGTELSVVTLTDHGTKVPVSSCGESPDEQQACFDNPDLLESQVSMGYGSVTASQMREKVQEVQNQRSMVACGCVDCECRNVPPMIFNFDHCYSGGMLDALFDPESGNTLDNVCGLAASGESELSLSGENIAIAMHRGRSTWTK